MSKEFPCIHFDEGKCKKFSVNGYVSYCGCDAPCEYQNMSNADLIRSMTDRTLCVWLSGRIHCAACPVREECRTKRNTACTELLFKWLTQSAEGESNAAD